MGDLWAGTKAYRLNTNNSWTESSHHFALPAIGESVRSAWNQAVAGRVVAERIVFQIRVYRSEALCGRNTTTHTKLHTAVSSSGHPVLRGNLRLIKAMHSAGRVCVDLPDYAYSDFPIFQ